MRYVAARSGPARGCARWPRHGTRRSSGKPPSGIAPPARYTPIGCAWTIRCCRDSARYEVHVLTADQRLDLICRLERFAIERRTDEKGRSLGPRARVWADLPDVVRALLATGVRLGELLALTGPDFTRDGKGRPIVTIAAHIVRDDGQLVRKAYRKGNRNQLLLQVPEWSVPMWYQRSSTAGTGPMFAAWNGGWIHPDNLGHRIREAFDACGYQWLTSHGFRKTVASVLADANLPSRAIADQLGHSNEATARKFYVAKASNARSADVLENIIEEK